MSDFYNDLQAIEELLKKHLQLKDLGRGQLLVNGYKIDTNQQLEMLSPAFFTGAADNPTIDSYKEFFQKMGVLPKSTAEIPLIRDVPLRTKARFHEENQQALFARFLDTNILVNQWTMLFPDEYLQLRKEIEHRIRNKIKALDIEIVREDEEGKKLHSGGYTRRQYEINGMKLWLRDPESLAEKDIEAAIERSLCDRDNTNQIVNSLKPLLLAKDKIAFNIRGVAIHFTSLADIQNKGLGGGHQNFLMLDRTTNTIYAINDTINATTEDSQAFKQQIQLFLKQLGDNRDYKFQYLEGKSRQPDNQAYLQQSCSISQFFHYAAILSGVKVNELRSIVPAKLSTLMYLLQYAYSMQDMNLFKILNQVYLAIAKEQANSLVQSNSSVQSNSPVQTNSPVQALADRILEEILMAKDPNKLLDEEKLAYVKLNYKGHRQLITAIERLEAGSKSWNPYWMYSGHKLDCIVEALLDCKRNKDRYIGIDLADPQSRLSAALNMRRLPSIFFCCPTPTKSEDIINENIAEFR